MKKSHNIVDRLLKKVWSDIDTKLTEGIYTELLSIWGNTVNYIAFKSKPQFTFEKGSMLKFSKLKESSSKVSIDVGLMSEHDEDIAKIILDYINSQV